MTELETAHTRAARAYAFQGHDLVRATYERTLLARTLDWLLEAAGGAQILELGCGDGLAAELVGQRLERYVGIDLRPAADVARERGEFLCHDLRDGIGAVGSEPFDIYLGSFGVASHLSPRELDRVVEEIGAHGRPGSIVALEALGRYSLEWPGLWEVPPGDERTLPYLLAAQVEVHPWSPDELRHIFERAGLEWIGALDRTVQAGPKLDDARYWPSLPPLRRAINRLLAGDLGAQPILSLALPPLPAHPAAAVHQALAARRRAVAERPFATAEAAARAVWALEPLSAGGYGHGLLALGRVRA